MLFRDTCHSTLLLILSAIIIIVPTDSQPWDIALADSHEISFVVINQTETNQTETNRLKAAEAEKLQVLAYDSTKNSCFIAVTDNNYYATIYSLNLHEKHSKPQYVSKQPNSEIYSTVFDPVDRMLYLADNKKQAVTRMKIPLGGEQASVPEIIQNLTGRKLYAIQLDICNRFIYSMSCAADQCRIERSKLNGGDKHVIVSNRHMCDFAIDNWYGKLYWIDCLPGFNFEIWRSNTDGTDREVFLKDEEAKPFRIAVDNEELYWIDFQTKELWMGSKNKSMVRPRKLKSFSNMDSERSISIIARQSKTAKDCGGISKSGAEKTTPSETPSLLVILVLVLIFFGNNFGELLQHE